MTKQEFWSTVRGVQLASKWIGAKAEYIAATKDPANHPVNVYRRAFMAVNAEIAQAMNDCGVSGAKYYADLAGIYGKESI